MLRTWAIIVAISLGLVTAACSSDEESGDSRDSEPVEELERCAERVEEKDLYIEELEKRLADNEVSGEDAVVVRIEGDDLEISGSGPRKRAGGGGAGSAKDAELYETFVQRTRRSREAIAHCYQNALKNNTDLQARSVQLEIEVNYRSDGRVSAAQFEPNVSPDFSRCMEGVAERWEIPSSPGPVTFKRSITLTPE